MRIFEIALLLLATASCEGAKDPPFHLIPGAVPFDKGPDGNTIILDARDGLIVVDTGRHPAHAQAILDYARERGRPIAAIVNTHWHLDHTTGNWDIRKVYPDVQVYASNGLEGAIAGFFPASRKGAEEFLNSGKASPAARAEIERGFHTTAYDYDAAWRWALAMTRSQRQARLKWLRGGARSAAP